MSYWIYIKITLTILFIPSLSVVGPEDGVSVRITDLKATSWDNLKALPGHITWPRKHFKGLAKVNVVYAILTGR